MRILFSTFGSLGDIHPYIAVALEARSRGHEPVFATSPRYEPKIRALGLGFRPVRPDVPAKEDFAPLAQRVMDAKTGTHYLFKELLMPALRQNYADLLEASTDADVIITHPAAPGGPLAARKLGKPWLSSVLAPISLWSRYDPPVPPTMPRLEVLRCLGPLWGGLSLQAARMATRSWVAEVDNLSREENLPEAGHAIFEGSFSPFGTLALFSRHFAAPQPDWPPHTTATGFCFYDDQGYEGQTEADWSTWIKSGKPPLVFTLGSSAVFGAETFFERSRGYAAAIQSRGLLLTGLPPTTASPSDDVFETAYAPYSVLFPQAAALVHQGGIGTTGQALRAGVPQIVVPFAHDQPDNAARLRRLGVALVVNRRNYEDGKARSTFNTLQAQREEIWNRAQALHVHISGENGPATACRVIEQINTTVS